MSVEELHILSDSNKIDNSKLIKINLLLSAVNDWPSSFFFLDDFIKELQIDLNSSDLTSQVIKKRVAKLNPADEAWKMEAYAAILELLALCNYKTLNEAVTSFENIKGH